MELNIVCYFDYYPFYQTKKKDMNELDEKISSFFADKSYTEFVQSFYIAIIGYRKKRKLKRPRYYDDVYLNNPLFRGEKYHMYRNFEMEIELDYNHFFASDRQGGYNIIARTLLKALEEMKYPLKIRKEFDKDRFNRDMRDFFVNVMHCNLEDEVMTELSKEDLNKLEELSHRLDFLNTLDGVGLEKFARNALEGLMNYPKEKVEGMSQLDKLKTMVDSVLKDDSEKSLEDDPEIISNGGYVICK